MSYVISLAVGFGVGLLYFLLRVNSPAPPMIALCGLLGIVCGEHAIPTLKAYFATAEQKTSQAPVGHVPGWVAATKLRDTREALAVAQQKTDSGPDMR